LARGDEFAWRLLGAGFPLLRVTLQLRTLHPQYLGVNFVWWRTTGRTNLNHVTHEVQDLFTHEVQDLYGHEDNPVRRVLVGGETIRRRVDVPDDKLEFPILRDLKTVGALTTLLCRLKARSAPITW
jgi:adenylate cyclase